MGLRKSESAESFESPEKSPEGNQATLMTLFLHPMKILMNQRERIKKLQQHLKLEMLLDYLPDVYVPKPGGRSPETEQRGSEWG